jgi:hypothetical protein
MRLTFFLLILLNLAFLVWSAGYLGTQDAGREPERLSQQISPEKIRIVAERQATSANSDADPVAGCRLVNNLGGDEASVLEKSLASNVGVTTKVLAGVPINTYWVLIPSLATRPAADKKLAEIRKLGVDDAKIVENETLGPVIISLGIFSTDKLAQDYLATMNKKGVRSAQVEIRQRPSHKVALEVRGATEPLQRLADMLTPYPGASLTECAVATP